MIFYLDFPAWPPLKSHHLIVLGHILESHPVVISTTSDYSQWLIPVYIKGENECNPGFINDALIMLFAFVICTDLLWFSLCN